MTDFISIIICTYNPALHRLNQTIEGLKKQTLNYNQWELIIIDNNSDQPPIIDLNWHPNKKIVREEKQGLTNARLTGFSISSGDIIVMVDDDNVLKADYLEQTLQIFKGNEKIGAAGGKSLPQFEGSEPVWLKEFYSSLALRNLGNDIKLENWENKYPAFAPIGAGMAIRKSAISKYLNKQHVISDRTGLSLSSGGDNDIVIEVLKQGWHVGYFPSLELIHIIPVSRTTVHYLARLLFDTNKSWVQLLEIHSINPWDKIAAWSVPLRKLKAWFIYKAWKNTSNFIKWKGACGTYEGLSL